jgi:hypothetical protein
MNRRVRESPSHSALASRRSPRIPSVPPTLRRCTMSIPGPGWPGTRDRCRPPPAEHSRSMASQVAAGARKRIFRWIKPVSLA